MIEIHGHHDPGPVMTERPGPLKSPPPRFVGLRRNQRSDAREMQHMYVVKHRPTRLVALPGFDRAQRSRPKTFAEPVGVHQAEDRVVALVPDAMLGGPNVIDPNVA